MNQMAIFSRIRCMHAFLVFLYCNSDSWCDQELDIRYTIANELTKFCSSNMLTCFYSVRLATQIYLPNILYLRFHGFKPLIPHFEGR